MKLLRRVGIIGLALLVFGGLTAASIKWRGFRALSPPGALESFLGRSIRDFAIPRAEHLRVNPALGDPVALSEGRETFLSRCAVCHGIDGRGRTLIGANQYPRVPDLRSGPAQGLTDGDLHYIIENGVQFSGMPAMHAQSTSESWNLVAFIRSLHASTP